MTARVCREWQNVGRIEAFYDGDPTHEWERLERHPVELPITLRALKEHLPARTEGIEPLMAEGGFAKIALVAAEPLSTEREEQLQRIPGDLRDAGSSPKN